MKTHAIQMAATAIAALIIAGFLAAVPGTKEPSPGAAGTTIRVPAVSNGLLDKLCGKAVHQPKPAALNSDSLKGSDWYSIVMADISRKAYYIATTPGGAGSINPRQGLKVDYNARGFVLGPLEKPELPGSPEAMQGKKSGRRQADKWRLGLSVKGLYANGALVCAPDASAGRSSDTSELSFHHQGLLTVQYQNTEVGLRQNFIVERSPVANAAELRVKLQASAGWVVNKTDDREIHFAKRTAAGLRTRVIYKDLNVWDADGKKLAARMEKHGSCADIVVAATGAKYPVTIDPLATTAVATITGGTGSGFGFSVAGAGDVNGDGYGDVIVGAPNVSSNTGAAYVYLGSSTGLYTTAAVTLSNATASSKFGYSVAGAGDVNGDGYSDVIVGAPDISSYAGAAYAYLGSATGLSATAATTYTGSVNSDFGISVASAGDVNGDGYSDVVIGACNVTYGSGASAASGAGVSYLYAGSSSGLPSAPTTTMRCIDQYAQFGFSVAGAGDVNGDGYSDVIIGAYGGPNIGYAYVYLGGSAGLAVPAADTLTNGLGEAHFGFSVAGAGDVNGDGYADVIAGAGSATLNTGAVYLYPGSSAGVSATPAITIIGSTGSQIGNSVSGAGDVNGDGYADVIVGAAAINTAYVYTGSATGLSATAVTTLTGASGSKYGFSVAGIGDIDGDGYSDAAVGAADYFAATINTAYIYTGSAGGIAGTAAAALNGTTGSSFGVSVASAGDVNGDGYGDVIVGAYQTTNGNAYIFLGGSAGLATTAATTLSGTSVNSYFGLSVAGAGDVNGDGYSDVIVGADGVASSAGAAYVYHGSSAGLSTTPAATLAGPTAAYSQFGYSVAGAGDVNGDGYSDVIVGAYGVASDTGAAYVYHGSSAGISTAAATVFNGTAGSYFGCSVAGAGDVNGDGYGDVIVGAYGISSFAGAAYVYHGASTGLSTTAATNLSGSSSSFFGVSVAGAGDVNGDGYGDVIVGAYGFPANTGAAYVYHGASTGLSTTAAATFSGTAGSFFGNSVASAGDVNGDGYSDVIVGALGITSSTGAAYLYQGSSTGLSAAAIILSGPAIYSQFGYSVAGAGDVNGDGYSDVIVGAYHTTNGDAKLYAGNGGYDKRNNTLRLYNTNLSSPLSQSNRNAAQFGAGLFVRPFAGAAKARLVWETEKEGVGFMHFSPITNYAGFTAGQTFYTAIPPAGVELKTLISKAATAHATKLRVRVQYLGARLPNGQKFGPWIYPQAYLTGAMASGIQFGLSGQPLPVGLTAFSAKAITDKDVLLSWSVANPKEAAAYTVERSSDGAAFNAIGSVKATGASEYRLHDYQPSGGRSYYHLRIAATDGSGSYSGVESVFIGKGSYVHVYPSPAKDYFIIETSEAATGTISDMQGRVLISIGTVQSGVRINIAALAPGVYVLKLSSRYSVKITKE